MHRSRTAGHREGGAAAVELAIVLPILILLVFGIVEFSIMYNAKQGLHAAAREGARLGALPQTTKAQIVDRVEEALDGVAVDTDDLDITITPNQTRPCDLQPAGTPVVVTVESTANLAIPLWGSGTVTLTGKGEFKCE